MINWTDDMTAELTLRWLAGESYDRIGLAMRVSRNAVASKILRLDLKRPEAVRSKRWVAQSERMAFARESRWEQQPVTLPRLKWLDNYSIA